MNYSVLCGGICAMKKYWSTFKILSIICAINLIIPACTTVSETGRRQVMLLSDERANAMGLSSFQQMKGSVPISTNPELNALVQRVGQKIAGVVDLPGAQWEFVVFDSPQANAFCLPGGKVGVYTGILPITQTEEGLAVVIGHEVAHAVAKHGAERVSEQLALQAGGTILGIALGKKSESTQKVAQTVYGLGANLGRALPHSRKQESEADYLGLLYMARAGYNPEEAANFWQRFSDFNKSAGGQSTPWFLRTHPLDTTRINNIRSWLPEARAQMPN